MTGAGHLQPRVELRRKNLAADPVEQFHAWFEEAARFNDMPEAVALATVDTAGHPDVRMVLLKGADPDGFRFFTNYDGVKAGQITANPTAALAFNWPELSRQVRIRGQVERLGEAESDAYFASRDRASQVGAWASPQSRPLEGGRDELEESTREVAGKYPEGAEIPRPPHWGGFRLVPERVEFWQGRPARLHDRFRYSAEPGGWRIERLAP